jgi:hypothetical protein
MGSGDCIFTIPEKKNEETFKKILIYTTLKIIS